MCRGDAGYTPWKCPQPTVIIRGMEKIDKRSVWAMFTQMRLRCFLEYVYELENAGQRSGIQEQLYQCAREFLAANPAEILEAINP